MDQDQYVKNITSRFEKSFKHPFKGNQSPLPTNFIPSKNDSPVTEDQIKEIKLKFGNLSYYYQVTTYKQLKKVVLPSQIYHGMTVEIHQAEVLEEIYLSIREDQLITVVIYQFL